MNQPDDELELAANVDLANLAGFEIVPVPDPDHPGVPRLELRHRCGWSQPQPFEGITGDNAAYLGNVVVRAVRERLTHRCLRT